MDDLEMLYELNERLSLWDRDSPYVELAQAAVNVAACAAGGPCCGAACEIDDAVDALERAIAEWRM